MNKRWLTAILLVFSLTLAACQPGSSAATAATAAPVTPEQSVIVQGRVEPRGSIDLAFGGAGRVAEVLVSEGQTVEAGQVIARLGGQEGRLAELARAQQEKAAAEQAIKDLTEGAELNAAQAEMRIVEAMKALDDAQEKVDDLSAQYSPDPKEVNEAKIREHLAEVQLQTVKDQAAALEDGMDTDLLAAAQMRRDTAESAVVAAQAALDALELKAPLAGTLVGLDVQAGQFVSVGQVVGSVADFGGWLVKTDDLTELEVVRIRDGARARVILDALPENEMDAEVTHISQRFEEKRGDVTYTVTLAISNPAEGLRWGMTGQVRFVESE